MSKITPTGILEQHFFKENKWVVVVARCSAACLCAQVVKHFTEMTEKSFYRGFPLAIWKLADGDHFINNSPYKDPRAQAKGFMYIDLGHGIFCTLDSLEIGKGTKPLVFGGYIYVYIYIYTYRFPK